MQFSQIDHTVNLPVSCQTYSCFYTDIYSTSNLVYLAITNHIQPFFPVLLYLGQQSILLRDCLLIPTSSQVFSLQTKRGTSFQCWNFCVTLFADIFPMSTLISFLTTITTILICFLIKYYCSLTNFKDCRHIKLTNKIYGDL